MFRNIYVKPYDIVMCRLNKVYPCKHSIMWFPHRVYSVKIPGVPDEVRKQFKEMILNEKDLASAGDAQPATGSDDTSKNNGTTSMTFLFS